MQSGADQGQAPKASETQKEENIHGTDDNAPDNLLNCLQAYLQRREKRQMGLGDILEELLRSGGDDRLLQNPKTGMNKYHTPIRPCEGVHRGSCTSNVPTKEAYERGLDIIRRLVLECRSIESKKEAVFTSPDDLFIWLLTDVRERLRSIFQLNLTDTISLFPSGTDAEFLPALLAIARCFSEEDETGTKVHRVLSIVSAAGEVGSGTRNAAVGQHFSKLLPSGKLVAGGSFANQVFGTLPENAFCAREMPLRDDEGRCRSTNELDAEVEQLVQSALNPSEPNEESRFGCVVLHMVVGSKTGHCVPSPGCVDRLAQKHGKDLVVVVDACQGRMGEFAVREHLDKGRVVLTTGSKFYGGAPFSGVCIMPGDVTDEMESLMCQSNVNALLDKGSLREYVQASLLSDDLATLRSKVPHKPLNYGVLLRWTLALHEMEAFFIDMKTETRNKIMGDWAQGVRNLIEQQANPLISQLQFDRETDTSSAEDSDCVALGTIICFECKCRRSPESAPESLSLEELRHLQYLMATDLGEEFPGLRLFQAARLRCFMGQPVCLNPGSAKPKVHILRVAASAPLVVAIRRDGLESHLSQDKMLFEKLNLILANWNIFDASST